MDSSTLELHQEIGGWRDYLDGRPIHCGDQLMLLTDAGWIWARYEADLRPGSDAAGYLESTDRTRTLDRVQMRFRWPTRDD